ncbi:MAG TPA: cysteine desulfurase-like protein [Gemmatimonadaceae bacterium]|nr:cysteine desulfurase-like protein [Gemmatimonadaceae bacterium]
MTRVAGVEEIRDHFPALERRHGGRPVAYFDGPGGTQVPRAVTDAMVDYLHHHNANTHWNYPTSMETDDAIAAARVVLADFLGGRPDEIAFGANMTTLTFHVARALGRGWGAGDEIVVTELDHHANVAPWRDLERERGVTIRTVPMRVEDGTLDEDALQRAIGRRTRLLAIGAASNALGTITDVPRWARLARDAGALVFVDAVHYAPHALVDVQALGCDFLACSAYKFYGPHIGVLWARRDLIERLEVPKLIPAPDEPPERLETGTQNHEGIVGAAAAVDFIASLAEGGSRRERLGRAFEVLHARGSALLDRLWRGLEAADGVRLHGPPPGHPRTPTLSFTMDRVPSGEVASALSRHGIFCSNGDFYAATVVERLGLAAEGLVRAGCACYTTEDEIDALVAGVAAIAGRDVPLRT